MLSVLKKEFRLYFYSPTGWIFLSVFLLVSGITFSIQHVFSGNPNYSGFVSGMLFILLFSVPMLTMRLFAEEKHHQTDLLLLTGPTPLWAIVLGKYLSAVVVFLIPVITTLLYPILLQFHGDMDWAVIFGTYIGFFLIGCSFIAIGMFISNITEGIVGAALLTFCSLITTFIIDFFQRFMPSSEIAGLVWMSIIALALLAWLYFTTHNQTVSLATLVLFLLILASIWFINQELFSGLVGKSFTWLSLTRRYGSFPIGIIRLDSVLYYITFSGFFFFLTIQGLEKRRWK